MYLLEEIVVNSVNKITCAIKRALVIGVASSAALTTTHVFANETDVSKVERIEVTGSRINRTDVETASPVTVISSDFIMQSGFQSVEEILDNIKKLDQESVGILNSIQELI